MESTFIRSIVMVQIMCICRVSRLDFSERIRIRFKWNLLLVPLQDTPQCLRSQVVWRDWAVFKVSVGRFE
jgi:hypothetical protein